MAHRVGIIGGDGIGPEVTAEALKVVRARRASSSTTTDYDLGGRRYLATGEVLPDSVLEELRGFDAILLGAVGTPEVPPGVLERGLLLEDALRARPLRQPAPVQVGREPPQRRRRLPRRPREHRGHLRGRRRLPAPGHAATRSRPRDRCNTRLGVERCIRFAFDLAQSRPRKHLTLVHKTNVLTFAGDLWQRTFDAVAADYPDVATAYNHVDAACIYFVQDPQRYDVIVTDNLFGDILTDLGGAIAGGIGRAASANLNPARTGPRLFEPVHGSAPDIAGTGQADPRAAVISAAMMLRLPRRGRCAGPDPNGVDKTDDV